jgi:membrane-associated protein
MDGMLGAVELAAGGPLADTAEWAARAGYFAILLIVAGDGVFPILPGETAIIAGAVFAGRGDLELPLVILAGAVGAVIGDSAAYWIGRAGGDQIRRGLVRLAGEDRITAAERMVARRGSALVFVGRFLPGIRLAINISCGAGQMAYGRFLVFDSLGALIWSSQAALLGYFAGRAFADQLWVAFAVGLGVAAIVGAAVFVVERRRIRREREEADREAEAEARERAPSA